MTLHNQFLCAVEAIPINRARGFDITAADEATTRVFALRLLNAPDLASSIRVYADYCPHQGLALPWRTDAYFSANGLHIACSAHGALFDPASGLCIAGPCEGEALIRYPIQIDAHGQVFLGDKNDNNQ